MARPDISPDEGTITGKPHEAALAGLQEWHRIAEHRDWKSLPGLLAENVVFRNPASADIYRGSQPMVSILEAVFSVMQDFTYLRHFSSNSGFVLEFSAQVDEEHLSGVDLIEFDQSGKITDFMVMMRPADVVHNLSAKAAQHLAIAHLP